MKTPNYHYCKVQLLAAATRVAFCSLGDFVRFVELNNLYNIFLVTPSSTSDPTDFAVTQNQVVFQHATLGYKTIEDYKLAATNNFPDSTSYYEAQQAGYKKYDEYHLVKIAGIGEKELFEKIRQQGFVKGFDDFSSIIKSDIKLPPTLPEIKNAYELYEFASKGGFEHYTKFKEALIKGFTDDGIQKIAYEHGFPDYFTYSEALKLGFRTYSTMETAKQEKVRDYADFMRKVDLKWVGKEDTSYDQRLLMVLLSRIEHNKKVLVNKLHTVLIKTLDTYRYEDTNELPAWFDNEFVDINKLVDFLSTSPLVHPYGVYNLEEGIFEIFSMQSRKVVIDGVNVANYGTDQSNKPSLNNLLLLAKFLSEKGFTDVDLLQDPDLNEKIKDEEDFETLESLAHLFVINKDEISYDAFIIGHVKRNHCLIITNELFKSLVVQDAWISENFDFYRLSYSIEGEIVHMPDVAD